MFYAIEDRIRGLPAAHRAAGAADRHQAVDRGIQTLARCAKFGLGKAIRYTLNNWGGLTRLIDDGRIEIDADTAERSIKR